MSDREKMEATGEGPIIGIDLGTSTSAIAVLQEDGPLLLADDQGDTIVPSVVQVAPGNQILVGTVAKAGAVAQPDRTALEVKRLMGTKETLKLGPRLFTPEDVSALILGHLKKNAEERLGEPIKDIVLSVPARFENEAREATRRAAEKAGLNVVRLINEPTAAALAYGLNHMGEQQKVLVFDFGGGTLDVTVLEMFEGVLDVKTSVGDDRLGGKDVDDAIVQILRDTYRDQHGKKLPPPSRDRKLAQILKEEAETCKKMLSLTESVDVHLPDLMENAGISITLTRPMLEERLEEMLMRAMALCNEALARARTRWDQIDVVLPIGGSSRIPLFRRALELTWGHSLKDWENPDEAVARGAAIAAGIERRAFEEAQQSLMILDVSPHRLGVATIKQIGPNQFIEDYFSEIIPKDAKLPAQARREYQTQFQGNDPISIRVFEATSGSNLCRDHHLIADLPLRKLSADADTELVQVNFLYTLDGTLEVAVNYVNLPSVKVGGRFAVVGGNSGVQAEHTTNPFSNGAASTPPDLWKLSPHIELCLPLIQQAERIIQQQPDAEPILRPATDALKSALVTNDELEMRRYLDALTDVLFDVS